MKAHAHAPRYLGGDIVWHPAMPPSADKGTTGRLRCCSYCGSMHPEDLAAALKAGAKGHWADLKYGWPHKFYVDDVPNPHAGMLEVRSSSNRKTEQYPHEVREPRYDPKTGARVEDYVTYTETPKPAAPTTWGKFYSEHLQDATPEDAETIMAAMGLRFTFSPTGEVRWTRYQPKEF